MIFRSTQVAVFSIALAALVGACNREPNPQASEASAQAKGTSPTQAVTPAQATQPSAGGDMMAQMQASCPMSIPDAKVRITDNDGGVTLDFETDAAHAKILQQRVENLANMYAMHRTRGMMWHHMGAGQMRDRHDMASGRGDGHMMGSRHMGSAPTGPMPATKASVESTSTGARLLLTPEDPSQLDALRQHVHTHHERMQGGECWM